MQEGSLFSTLSPAFILLLFKFILYLYILKMQLLEKFKWHKGLTYFSFKKFIIIIFLEAQYFYQAKPIWHIVFILYARHFSLRLTPISSFKPFPQLDEAGTIYEVRQLRLREGESLAWGHKARTGSGWDEWYLNSVALLQRWILNCSIPLTLYSSQTCVCVCVCVCLCACVWASLVDQW